MLRPVGVYGAISAVNFGSSRFGEVRLVSFLQRLQHRRLSVPPASPVSGSDAAERAIRLGPRRVS